MTLREEIRIEIIKWLGSKYTVTPYMAEPSDKDIDQNSVEELVGSLYNLVSTPEPEEPPTDPYINITVNGGKISLLSNKISYQEIVNLAWPSSTTGVLYTITFSKAFDNRKHEGFICPGEDLIVTDGTRISCYHTGAA